MALEFLNNSRIPTELGILLISPVRITIRILIEFLINSRSSAYHVHTWGDEDAKNDQMKLHGWTDAFQRYFHSFYKKEETKLVNHRTHTKAIYFVDINQGSVEKDSDGKIPQDKKVTLKKATALIKSFHAKWIHYFWIADETSIMNTLLSM